MAKSMPCAVWLIWIPVLALLSNYLIMHVFLISGVSVPPSIEWEPYPPHWVLSIILDCSWYISKLQLAAAFSMLCFRVWAGVRIEFSLLFNSYWGRENCKKFQTCLDLCSIFTSFHTCPMSRLRSWGKWLCWKRLPVGLITCGFNNHFLLPKWYGWGSLLLLVPKDLYVCLGNPESQTSDLWVICIYA